ncbi:MAG TPA: hypothetical protein VND40_01260 [Nitrososphaerales archaeon]|nr:hypothetical protein [Nitrososphaerales archaeon]
MVGGPLGFYTGRITIGKMKEAVKWFVETELEMDLGKVNIPIENVAIKPEWEMDKVLERSRFELYQVYKRGKPNP